VTKGRFNFSPFRGQLFENNPVILDIHRLEYYKVKIEPGDMLYIPWGWWHEVKTDIEIAASLTYFFDSSTTYNLLSYFLGFQSNRLNEIKEDTKLQNLIYFTDFSNWSSKAKALLQEGHYWFSTLLTSAMLEELIRLKLNSKYDHIFLLIKHHPSSKIDKILR